MLLEPWKEKELQNNAGECDWIIMEVDKFSFVLNSVLVPPFSILLKIEIKGTSIGAYSDADHSIKICGNIFVFYTCSKGILLGKMF